jgi:hypothetical protein
MGTNQTIAVRLFDKLGQLVKLHDDTRRETDELISAPFADLPPDEMLVVDMTMPRKLAHAAWLDSARVGKAGWPNARNVRALSPREVPFRWQGLEAVDAMVWDDADPSALSLQQVDAITGWVKAGGRLLITAGSNWQALGASSLAAILPVKITGAGESMEAAEFLDIVNNEDYRNYLEKCYAKKPIVRCAIEPLPEALAIPAECDFRQIVYRRLLGRGSVTFVAASLRQLLPPPEQLSNPDAERAPVAAGSGSDGSRESPQRDWFINTACEQIIARGFLSLPEVRKDENSTWNSPIDLFQYACDSVAFGTSSAAYLVFAIFFAIAYTMFAAVGSYWYLTRRSWQHHCWTAFAAVSVAGSIIGTGMVWTLRGFSTNLWQTTVIDSRAGVDYGYADCLLGVKTPKHQRLDLQMTAKNDEAVPPDEASQQRGSIRPMPQPSGPFASNMHFVAPENYQSLLTGAELNGVQVRATLKEFQSCWEGPLGGTLEAKLVRQAAAPHEFIEGSFIRNRLGITLKDCYLIETPTPQGEQRAIYVNCWQLGAIPASGKDSTIDAQRLGELLYFEKDAKGELVAPLKHIGKDKTPRLDQIISGWRGGLGGLRLSAGATETPRQRLTADEEYHPLYLLSVFNLLEGPDPKTFGFRRSHARLWDCLDQLSERTAILIGHSEEAPPAILEVDRVSLRPSKARTVYRFVIPVERQKP